MTKCLVFNFAKPLRFARPLRKGTSAQYEIYQNNTILEGIRYLNKSIQCTKSRDYDLPFLRGVPEGGGVY